MLFLLLCRVKDPHEFFTGDRFLFIQHLRQLIQQRTVLRQQAVRPLMLRADELNDLAVDLALRLLRAAHGRIAAQILIPRGLHGDHVEFIRHAVLRDHGARDARGLLDVVRSAGRDLAERDLLGRAAAGQRGQLGQKLAAGHQVLFALLDLHGVAQRTGRARDDRDLLHGRGIRLQGSHERVADLMDTTRFS